MTVPPALAPVVADPARSALLVDFDGSIARIVEDPAAARPVAGAVDALARLAPRLRTLAVVSGRPAAFLARHLPIDGLAIVGLYGLERMVDGVVVPHSEAAGWRAALTAAADEAEAALPGLLVERKSGLSMTVHWRTEPEREAEALAVVTALGVRHGLRGPERGRRAAELRVPVDVDKGTIAVDLAAGAHAAVFAGDDVGDLLGFAALRAMQADGRVGAATCVGVASPEAPSEILDADVVVDGPDGLVALLVALERALQRA